MASKKEVLRRTKDVLAKGIEAVETVKTKHGWVEPEKGQMFRNAGLSLIADVYSTNHLHYKEFNEAALGNSVDGWQRAIGVIKIIYEEIQNDLLIGTRALIAAELFNDFLEMATYLLDEGYKDAAAVIAGSSLEAHLRRLCDKTGISTIDAKGKHKKADLINSELAKAGVYGLTEQKQITAWLGLRNDAAHGDYAKVTSDAVRALIEGARFFTVKYPG